MAETPSVPNKKAAQVTYWREQIQAARKREKNWRKKANELIQIFEADDDDIPYNILYSNTETLAPALYGAVPRPDTRPRVAQNSATAMAAAGLCDAFLEYFIDSGSLEYTSFGAACETALREALVPGRGLQRFHYHAEIESDAQGPRKVREECVFVEELPWDRVLFGHAKVWSSVPWVSFIHVWTQEEAEEKLGVDVAAKLTYAAPGQDEGKPVTGDKTDSESRVAVVHEIWDKRTRQVHWLEEESKEAFLKPSSSDPFKLENFFPMQEPLQFFRRVSAMVPVPLYSLYERQAKELNKLTRRIDKVMDQIRIRGYYDAGVEKLASLLSADDGDMIPIENLNSLAQGAKAENAVWLVPVEKHITVLTELIATRREVKMTIFEIMGIADIMRGASAASETLGAQRIKNQWGTLRLKKAQGETARFIRDGLRIAAELGFSKMAPETVRRMTGSTLPSQAELDALTAQLQAAGQPPTPEQINYLSLPAFEEALEALKNDLVRGYLIDIETNSSIDTEASEDKENVSEFLNAFSQFLNGAAPLMESGALPFPAAKAIMLSVTKRFNLGKQLYRELAQMQAPQKPQGVDPKVQKELEAAQAEIQQREKTVAEQQNKLRLDQIAFDSEKQVFQVEKKAADAISQANDRAKQAISTATGAAKSAQDKAAKVQDTAAMQKMVAEIQSLLSELKNSSEKASMEEKSRQERASIEEASKGEQEGQLETIVQTLLQGFEQMGKQISEGLVKAASVKRVAVKGKDGSWSSQTMN